MGTPGKKRIRRRNHDLILQTSKKARSASVLSLLTTTGSLARRCHNCKIWLDCRASNTSSDCRTYTQAAEFRLALPLTPSPQGLSANRRQSPALSGSKSDFRGPLPTPAVRNAPRSESRELSNSPVNTQKMVNTTVRYGPRGGLGNVLSSGWLLPNVDKRVRGEGD